MPRIGSKYCGKSRSAERGTGHRNFRPGYDLPDGENAAGSYPDVLGAGVSHASSCFASSGKANGGGQEGVHVDGADDPV